LIEESRIPVDFSIFTSKMAFNMQSAMRNTIVVAAMATLAVVEVSAQASAPGPAPKQDSHASALLPTIAAPAIFGVLSYVAMRLF
jgi:hypothetical protein